MGLMSWFGAGKRREEAYLVALAAIRDTAVAAAEAQSELAAALRAVLEERIGLSSGEEAGIREDGDTVRLKKMLDELSGGDPRRRAELREQATLNELDFS